MIVSACGGSVRVLCTVSRAILSQGMKNTVPAVRALQPPTAFLLIYLCKKINYYGFYLNFIAIFFNGLHYFIYPIYTELFTPHTCGSFQDDQVAIAKIDFQATAATQATGTQHGIALPAPHYATLIIVSLRCPAVIVSPSLVFQRPSIACPAPKLVITACVSSPVNEFFFSVPVR